MPHEVEAFPRRKQRERDRNELDDVIEASRSRRTEERLQLRKREFNRIEVRTVRWQEAEPCADALDGGLDLGLLVHREIVEHHDVARPQRGDEYLLDIGEKAGIVDRAVEGGRREAVNAQRRHDRVRLPMTVAGVVAEPYATRAASVPPQQIRGDPRFVDEDVVAGVVQRQRVLPVPARGRDVSAPLFVGVYGFF